MVETHRNGNEQGYWGYLIRPDKSAAPHLEQLCLGLCRIICSLEPGPIDRLTPRRLAKFYKSVGGNLDALFLRTSDSGLSFLYRTIGCYHSLEPNKNPFETPSTPCLTPEGFVKWQTVQLLLCPDEHVRYLQEAVKVYDIARPDGGNFPKSIPKEAFPTKPDTEMEAWHKAVTSQLNQESYMRRIRYSPYQSPQATHPGDRPDGYFSQTAPRVRRPSRPLRQSSRDEDVRNQYSRRSSEPDISSPLAGEPSITLTSPVEQARNPNSYAHDGRKRSLSATRPTPPRQRSATTGTTGRPQRPTETSPRIPARPPNSFKRWEQFDRPSRGRTPSGSSNGEESSGSDASSEDSGGQRQSLKSKATSTFLSVLPFTTPWHKRSRSHEPSSRNDKTSPRRDSHGATPPMRASTETFQRPPQSVRFRQDIFDQGAANSAPETPAPDWRPRSGHRPDPRFARNPGLTDPVSSANYNVSKETTSSGSGSERRSTYEIPSRQLRKSGTPQQGRPMVGVQGRKYASVEQSTAGPLPTSVPQQDPRTRYSLAV